MSITTCGTAGCSVCDRDAACGGCGRTLEDVAAKVEARLNTALIMVRKLTDRGTDSDFQALVAEVMVALEREEER